MATTPPKIFAAPTYNRLIIEESDPEPRPYRFDAIWLRWFFQVKILLDFFLGPGNTTTFLRGDGTFSTIGVSGAPPYAPGTMVLPTETGFVMTKRLTLTGTQRFTLKGTSRLRIT
jgi:hypothetical protein